MNDFVCKGEKRRGKKEPEKKIKIWWTSKKKSKVKEINLTKIEIMRVKERKKNWGKA